MANAVQFDADIRSRIFQVREPLSPVDWARTHLSLPAGLNARPGPFEPFPFQVEPLKAMVDPGVSSLTLCWASQALGKSQLLAILVGWVISEAPCGVVLIFPTDEKAEHWSRTKLAPMLRDCEALRLKVYPATGRKQADGTGGSTLKIKTFEGGYLVMAGSGSSSGVSSHTAKIVAADELDEFDPGGEAGDPLAQAARRSESFPDAKRLAAGTPTIRGASRIESELALSDCRKWHIPCLACEKSFVLMWSHIKWDKTPAGLHLPKTAYIECPHCQEHLSDKDRVQMVNRGHWQATNALAEPHRRGYWSNAFISLLPHHHSYESRLHQWVSEWLGEKSKGLQAVKAFVNTVFCESWAEENLSVEKPEIIWARREVYSSDEADPSAITLAEKVRIVTVGVDVQTDRLELETVGWSPELESWSLDYRIIRGNLNQANVWLELSNYLQTQFSHPYGFKVSIAGVGIDTGGHYTQRVYGFVGMRPIRNTFALKGRGLAGQQWLERSKTVQGLHLVSVDIIKRAIYDQLAITAAGAPGYIHIPATRDYLWVEQLTSEKCTIRKVNGVSVPRFELAEGQHNEALDARVYARTALEILRPAWSGIEKYFQEHRTKESRETVPAVERLAPEVVSIETGPNVKPSSQQNQGPRSHPRQRPRTHWWSGAYQT